MEERKMKAYTEEFKIKMVELYNAGKAPSVIVKEYGMARSALSKWINKYNNTGSFKVKDNRTDAENELIQLKKRNKQLEMENDILKQAALIIGRR